jgi:hypothetical protein
MAAPRIFLSYRREDASGHAGRLYDVLVERFGEENVFMDIDTIDVGADFAEVITRAVASCDALIALVGRQWLTVTNDEGRRRLDDPNDFVRLELESALQRNVSVVPACVQGAGHPSADQLPPSLAPLARRQGVELRDIGWHDDVKRLIERLERLVEPPKPRRKRPRRAVLAGIGVAVAVVAAVIAAALVLSNAASDDTRGGGAGFPNANERTLLAEVPPITRPSCDRIDWGDRAAIASVECSAARTAATYQLFPSASIRNAWYARAREDAGIEPSTGRCTAQPFRGEIAYQGGTAFCYMEEDQPHMAWADEGSRVGVEANVWKGTGKAAIKTMIRQWQCCLR